jgi:hypothetical protein
MNDRKNIERLFQEKFKDFEVIPPPGVWEGIASQLEKKKEKRRIFPFWFNAKAAGIAAALVLGLFVLNNNQGWVKFDLNDSSVNGNDGNHSVVEKGNPIGKKSATEEKKDGNPAKQLPSGLNGNSSENNEAIVSNQEAEIIEKSTQNSPIVNTDEFSRQSVPAKSLQTKSKSAPYIRNQKTQTTTALVQNTPNKVISSESNQNHPVADRKMTDKENYSKGINGINTEGSQFNNDQITAIQNSDAITKEKRKADKVQQLEQIEEITNGKKEIINNKDNTVNQKEAIADNNPKVKTQIVEANSVPDNVEGNEDKEIIYKDKNNPVNAKEIIADYNSKTKNQIAEKSHISDNVEGNEDKEIIYKDKNNPVNAKEVIADYHSKTKNQIAEKSNVPDNTSGNEISNMQQKNSNDVQKNIVVNQLEVEQKDSVIIAQTEENPLDKILKEKEKKKEKEEIVETPYSKWGVRPTIAALFSGSTQGSPISAEFADNKKTYDSKFGLGVGVDYRLNKKIALRAGVGKIDMAYNTEGISFFTDLSGRLANQRNMRNINRNSASENVIIQDRPRSTLVEIALVGNDVGVLKQQLGYIEVPMEVSYKIIDRKFGLQLITGLSTLFLSDNKISIISDGMTTEIGEANNLNKVHFSTNIGLGIKYNILKSLEASVEPMFKYQINTFSNDSGSFRPFVMGVYSGFSYKF